MIFLEHFIGFRNIEYSGIILYEEYRQLLLNKFSDNIPHYWKKFAHHMTICIGELPTIYRDYRNEEIDLYVTHCGYNENSIAVKVEGFFTINRDNEFEQKIPHITLATHPEFSPKESNNIKNWKKIKPFKIKGIIKEIYQKK